MSVVAETTTAVVSGSCHHDCPDTCGWHVTVDRSGPTPIALQMRGNPGLVSIPWGWWNRHHPDAMVANSLTNDTLTEWGGGAAFSDTLVEVSPR